MTNEPKRPGGLPTTDKMKNGINRESIVKNVPHSGLINGKPQSNNKNQK